jgi:hypothetical protein
VEKEVAMLPNPYLAEQIARDKQAEMRAIIHGHPSASRSLRLAWLAGLLTVALVGASIFVR